MGHWLLVRYACKAFRDEGRASSLVTSLSPFKGYCLFNAFGIISTAAYYHYRFLYSYCAPNVLRDLNFLKVAVYITQLAVTLQGFISWMPIHPDLI
jgi:hypothetical protein